MKCCAIDIDGVWHDVYKDPKTDPGKASKAGHLAVVNVHGTYRTVRREDGAAGEDLLVPVFENGEVLRKYTFEEIRSRVHSLDDFGE